MNINNYDELIAFLESMKNSEFALAQAKDQDDARGKAVTYEGNANRRLHDQRIASVIDYYRSQVFMLLAKFHKDKDFEKYVNEIEKLINIFKTSVLSQIDSPEIQEQKVVQPTDTSGINSMDDLREVMTFIENNRKNSKKLKLVEQAARALEQIDFTLKTFDGTRVFRLLPEDYIRLVNIIGVGDNLEKSRLADDLRVAYPGKNAPDAEALVSAIRMGAKVSRGSQVNLYQLQRIVSPSTIPGLNPEPKKHFAKNVSIEGLELTEQDRKHLSDLGRTGSAPNSRNSSVSSTPERERSPSSSKTTATNKVHSPSLEDLPEYTLSGPVSPASRGASPFFDSLLLSARDRKSRSTSPVRSDDLDSVLSPSEQHFSEIQFLSTEYSNLAFINSSSTINLSSAEKNISSVGIDILIRKVEERYNNIREADSKNTFCLFKPLNCFRDNFLENALKYVIKQGLVDKSVTVESLEKNPVQKLWVVLKYTSVQPQNSKIRTVSALNAAIDALNKNNQHIVVAHNMK